MKNYLSVFVLLFLSYSVFSQDIEFPKYNSDVTTYFNQMTTDFLKKYDNNYDIYPFFTVYDDAFFSWDVKVINQMAVAMTGSYFRINDYFSIPLCLTFTWPIILNHKDRTYMYSTDIKNVLLNSGVIFQGRYGIIAGFIGYSPQFFYDSFYEYSDPSYPNRLVDFDVARNTRHNLAYSVIPILNTAEYPLLGIIARSVEGFFDKDNDDSVNWSLKIVSQSFNLGNLSILAITPYYINVPYNIEAKNEIYGFRITMDISDSFVFAIEGGYKKYYNVSGATFTYEDTPFIRISLPFETYSKGDWFGLTLYMDKTFYTPKVGVIGMLSTFPFLAELSFYPYFSGTVGFTVPFADW